MSTVSKVIITTIIVIIVIIGGWWALQTMRTNETRQTSSEQTEGTNAGNTHDNHEMAGTITYDGTTFTPAEITVQAGDMIEVMNNSDGVLFFASDEHPTHLDNSELNVGDIQPGESAMVTMTTSGTWGYHDHYNASVGGQIIVE